MAATKSRSSRKSSSTSRKTGSGGGSGRKRASSSKRSAGANGNSQEVERYRRAAEDALQQLDWAIGYLHGIRKTDISKALAKNRSFIRTRLMGEADEPLPDQQTDET